MTHGRTADVLRSYCDHDGRTEVVEVVLRSWRSYCSRTVVVKVVVRSYLGRSEVVHVSYYDRTWSYYERTKVVDGRRWSYKGRTVIIFRAIFYDLTTTEHDLAKIQGRGGRSLRSCMCELGLRTR